MSAYAPHPAPRVPGRLRHACLLIAIGLAVLGLTACGGDDDSGGAGSDGGAVAGSLERVTSLTTQAVEALGADGAFDAALFALERGYSPAQVVAAVEGSRLLSDGMLASDPGTEAPEGSALGLIQLPDSATRIAERAYFVVFTEPVSAAVAREGARAAADELNLSRLTRAEFTYIYLILLLLTDSEGYTGEEIVQFLIFRQLPEREQILSSVLDRTGAATASSDEDEAETAEAPDAEGQESETDSGGIAGIYSGEMTMSQCNDKCTLKCAVSGELRVNVYDDGSLTAILPAQARSTPTECLEPLQIGWRMNGEWERDGSVVAELESHAEGFAVVAGEVGDGMLTLSFESDPRAGELGSVASFEATLTKE